MPMWISWVNPRTQKRERIYNYWGPETPEGALAIRVARKALAERFGMGESEIPGFRVEPAPWIPEREAP